MTSYPDHPTFDSDSAEDLVERATEYLARAVHLGVDTRRYPIAKRALNGLSYLHPAGRYGSVEDYPVRR